MKNQTWMGQIFKEIERKVECFGKFNWESNTWQNSMENGMLQLGKIQLGVEYLSIWN